jgi:hypothetical protein
MGTCRICHQPITLVIDTWVTEEQPGCQENDSWCRLSPDGWHAPEAEAEDPAIADAEWIRDWGY